MSATMSPDGVSPPTTPSGANGRPSSRPAVTITETAWMGWIADLARTWGWTVAHFRTARTVHGWRTPAQYDAKGFPDLVLVHPQRRRVIFAEVKAQRGSLDDDQAAWGDILSVAGADYRLWRPSDRPAVVDELTDGRAVAVL